MEDEINSTGINFNGFIKGIGKWSLDHADEIKQLDKMINGPRNLLSDSAALKAINVKPVVSNAGIAEIINDNLVPIIERQNEMLENDKTKIGLLESQYEALDGNYKQLEKANKTLKEDLDLAKSEIENNKKDIKVENIKSTLSLIITGLAFLVSIASLIVSIVGNVQ